MTDNSLGQSIALTGWEGGTTGFRVDAESRSRVLAPLKGTLRGIEVELPGLGVRTCCRITPTFWTSCPGAQIRGHRSLDGAAERKAVATREPAQVRGRAGRD